MRIKDVRQGLHTLLHTEGLDGLLHLYKRLEKRGRALLLCPFKGIICDDISEIAVGTLITERPPQSGRIEARIGLR